VIESVVKLGLTGGYNMQNTQVTTTTNQEGQTVAVTIVGPGTGDVPSRIRAFWDTLFGTMMFYLSDDTPTYTGTMMDAQGKPVPNARVQLTVGGTTVYSYTDSLGRYGFYGAAKGGVVTLAPVKIINRPRG
jgi:hypothetical protein